MLEIYQEIIDIISREEQAVLATVVSRSGSAPRDVGTKMLVKADGSIVGTIGGGDIEQRVREKAGEVLMSGEPQMARFDLSGKEYPAGNICGGEVEIFLEPVMPMETLYLFGAGHISQCVAAIGKSLNFRVVIIDNRPEFANTERFPEADFLLLSEYGESFERLNINRNSYIVIFTYGHAYDELCLEFAVGTEARYIGMIGSRKKVAATRERLLKKGVSAEQLDRVHAPVGLAIGAETPAEIAVSILAEIIKVRRSEGHKAKSKVCGGQM